MPEEKKPAGPEDKAATPEAAAGAAADEPPASPKDDPDFQAVAGKVKSVAKGEQAHAPATAKAQEAQNAAVEPKGAVLAKGKSRQVDQMQEAPAPPFDGAAFKAALKKRIAELTPKNLDEADSFKEKNKLGGVKREMSAKVDAAKDKSQGPLEKKTKEAPSTSGIAPKPVKNLPPADPGKAPAAVGADRAVPKPRGESAVEAPLEEGSRSLDDQMAEANVTDEQLRKSNEPAFLEASSAKSTAQTQAAKDAKGFRQYEKKSLDKAEAQAVAVARKEVQGMRADRAGGFKQVEGKQLQAKAKDEAARAKVAADIDKIYQDTKGKVDGILNALDAKVEQAFDAGAAHARQVFESHVEARMDAYKEARYSGWSGKAQWVADLFGDLPDEVNRFYEEGREIYLQRMDVVLDGVITIIGTQLTAARAEIQKGKDSIASYVAKLPGELKSVGKEAAADVAEKFGQLEESIQNKQGELIDTLAQKYQENLDAVDERIKELKEANKGLISKAAGLIKDVIEAIRKLKQLLDQILSRIANVIGLILADPIGFFDNLIAGLSKGFNNFVDNIQKHLIAGFFSWLTGALGPAGIKIPDDIFSLRGVFNLVMQVLGLTWDALRAKAVQLFGETVVGAMEKGAEIFMKLREGPNALWEYVKEQFSDLKEMVIEQIKEMVITEVIKAGVKWLLGLLNPVSAFVKAAMAIYDIVSFIFNRAAQIADFINSLLDAIEAIARGAIDGAAGMVEKALARSIPLIIGLLASLLGISGLVGKVQKLIAKIRKRIDAAIMKVLLKAKSLVGRLLGKDDAKKVEKEGNKGPDERTAEQKKVDVDTALSEGEQLMNAKGATPKNVREHLGGIKAKYRLSLLTLVTDNKTNEEEVVHLEGAASPTVKKKPKVYPVGETKFTIMENGERVLRPEYRTAKKIRPRLYSSSNRGPTKKIIADKLKTLAREQDPVTGKFRPTTDVENAQYWEGEPGEIVLIKDPRTKPTLAHNMSVMTHWNTIGNNRDQSTRITFYNFVGNESAARVLMFWRNREEGTGDDTGTYTHKVGPNFKEPGE